MMFNSKVAWGDQSSISVCLGEMERKSSSPHHADLVDRTSEAGGRWICGPRLTRESPPTNSDATWFYSGVNDSLAVWMSPPTNSDATWFYSGVNDSLAVWIVILQERRKPSMTTGRSTSAAMDLLTHQSHPASVRSQCNATAGKIEHTKTRAVRQTDGCMDLFSSGGRRP
jgi:hypothetical protein